MILISKTKVIAKTWGVEEHIHNSDGYCSKILRFRQGTHGSMHFHMNKTETWYILRGDGKIETIHPKTAERKSIPLVRGDVVHIPAGFLHKLHAATEIVIFEASTPDDSNDTYRVEPSSL